MKYTTVHRLFLTTNIELNLPTVLMMCELLNHVSSKKWSMRYETVHKLSILNKHWSKLTRCIDDVWIVHSQYHKRKWSMRYETAHKLSINDNTEVNLLGVLMMSE